jgi:hypothetical protein
MLETALTFFAKCEPPIGINHNDKATLPGTSHSATRVGEVCFAEAVPEHATQVAFNTDHASCCP